MYELRECRAPRPIPRRAGSGFRCLGPLASLMVLMVLACHRADDQGSFPADPRVLSEWDRLAAVDRFAEAAALLEAALRSAEQGDRRKEHSALLSDLARVQSEWGDSILQGESEPKNDLQKKERAARAIP